MTAYLIYMMRIGTDFRMDCLEFPAHGYARTAGEALKQLVVDFATNTKSTYAFSYVIVVNTEDGT